MARSFWSRVGRAVARTFGAEPRQRFYEAAKTNKGRHGWTNNNAGPASVWLASAEKLRARARDMARNDPHCARAVEVLAGNIVGTGMVPRFRVKSAVPADLAKHAPGEAERIDAENAALAALWKLWAEKGADVEGVHTLEALQAVAARGWVEGGESFVVRRWDKTAIGVPLRIDVLEADMCDSQRTGKLTAANDDATVVGQIIQGVEFDAKGRRVAYWFFDTHPGESWQIGMVGSKRVPAKDVIHLFLPLRPKQVRGLPFLAPILGMKADLDTFERFELARKQTEAAVAAFVIPGDNVDLEEGDKGEGLVPAAVDDNGDTVEDIQPRLILRLRNGKEVRFNTPMISANYDTYKRAMLQSCAVGVHLSYEWLTGDLSGANLSTLRAGLIEFWRYIDALQWNHFAPKVCARVCEWFLEAGYMAGKIASPSSVEAEWTAPARASLDPATQALVDILEIRAGLAPRAAKVQERGYEIRSLLLEMASDNTLIEKLEVVLDSDPKKMAFRGAFAQGVEGTPLADELPADGKEAA